MMNPVDSRLERANSLIAAGAADQAAELLSAIIEDEPRNADALHLLGLLSVQFGQSEQGLRLIESAVEADPTHALAMSNLATLLLASGQVDRAERLQREALLHAPNAAKLHFNLANILMTKRQLADATQEYRLALSLKPDFPEAWSNLGTVLRDMNDVEGALAAFETACEHRPDYPEARYNLANALRDVGRLTDAEAAIRRVIALRSGHAKAYNALGNILGDMARPTEARDAFAESVLLDRDWMPAASNFLSSLHYVPGVRAEALADDHRAWAERFAPPSLQSAAANHLRASADRTLNIGFVSPDFGQHPVGYFTASLFENLDRAKINPVIFSTRPKGADDHISARISGHVEWRWVDGLSDDDLFKSIRDAHIDILFDMSGHTAGHRLKVFARKPAPLQLSWIGYVGTTGVAAIDYVLADRIHAPESESFAGPERILRMPNGYVCYAPPENAPDVAPSPFARTGAITFGCLNNPAKLNDAVLASFARIVQAVPESRLVLRFKGLEDEGVQSNLRARLAGFGLDTSRVDIRGRGTHREFLGTYGDIDIALDTFPYSGGLTTCEALWMGVPVVTFPGATFASRHASSHLTTVGLTRYVASSQTEFEDRAVALASEREDLSALRSSLRRVMQESPLCDGTSFARDFALVLGRAWQDTADDEVR